MSTLRKKKVNKDYQININKKKRVVKNCITIYNRVSLNPYPTIKKINELSISM